MTRRTTLARSINPEPEQVPRRPSVSKKVIQGLSYAGAHLRAIRQDMGERGLEGGYSPEMRRDMDIALRYLDDLVNWYRATSWR